jgi:hypothetical protein
VPQNFFLGLRPVVRCVSAYAPMPLIQLVGTLADLLFDFGIAWICFD